MSLSIFCDASHEGVWFRSLSQHLANVPITLIKQEGVNPIYIERLLRYDRPDVILVQGECPKLVVEKTREVPTGHNIGQRFARIVNASEEGVMALFFIPFAARKHGKYSNVCYIPGRFFVALDKIEYIHQVPILAIDWPSDTSHELIANTENRAIRDLINDLIYHRFEYPNCEQIKFIRSRMLERFEKCNKLTCQTPRSAKIKNTHDYVDELTRKISGCESLIPTAVRTRPLSLVYEILMTEEKCRRTDPYTGTQFVYDYMECRKGRNVTDKTSNLILSLPHIRKKVWSKNNPNKHVRKSALWYATADMIVLKDGIIPCVSKVSAAAFEKQMLKMLDENMLYEKVKNYLKTTGWIILGGEPAHGTDHLPVIEVKDFNPSKGSKGSKKIDLVAFKDPFFLLSELHSSYTENDLLKLNKLTGSFDARRAFISALRDKKVLESNNIIIDYQKYIDSNAYLIKSVGYNVSTKQAQADFVLFQSDKDIVRPCFGNRISDAVKEMFNRF